jgi:hypothetical protein
MAKFLSLLLLCVCSPALAADWGWQHIALHPPGGAYIQVNFRVNCETTPAGQKLTVPELWIDADQPGIGPGRTPRVVFLTKDKGNGGYLAVKEIDLVYRGGQHASAPYPGAYSYNVLNTSEELALVLGGIWQKDTENGNVNFKFSLFDVITDLAERPCD